MGASDLYFLKLRDPRWQRRRLEIFDRDNFCCVECGNSRDTLHIHHRRYIKNIEPWDYPASLLMTVCEKCHEAFHFDTGRLTVGEYLESTLRFYGADADILRRLQVVFIANFQSEVLTRADWDRLLSLLNRLFATRTLTTR